MIMRERTPAPPELWIVSEEKGSQEDAYPGYIVLCDQLGWFSAFILWARVTWSRASGQAEVSIDFWAYQGLVSWKVLVESGTQGAQLLWERLASLPLGFGPL